MDNSCEITLTALIEDLFQKENYDDAPDLLQHLQCIINQYIMLTDNITDNLIDLEFLEDIKHITSFENIPVYFGKTMRDIKFLLVDDSFREHEVIVRYRSPKKLIVTSVKLPYSPIQDCEYSSLNEIIVAFRAHIESLSSYFIELQNIDRVCTVMEPLEPTFKDDFRRILLDDRTWLHIEVSPEGLATNLHLVGQSEVWSDKLQTGLLTWDHDKDIVENIMTVFDLETFPTTTISKKLPTASTDMAYEELTQCSICLCLVLPDNPSVPLPLCQNAFCGVYFHRSCLFQWLVACSGGRPPAFGVVTGSCPACFQTIACNEKDD